MARIRGYTASEGMDLDESAEQSRQLWCAVILQAFKDACRHKATCHINIFEIEIARGWCTGYSQDFEVACELAGLDVDFVRNGAIKLKEAGWPQHVL